MSTVPVSTSASSLSRMILESGDQTGASTRNLWNFFWGKLNTTVLPVPSGCTTIHFGLRSCGKESKYAIHSPEGDQVGTPPTATLDILPVSPSQAQFAAPQ